MVCIPEAVAIHQGLVPKEGFARWVNTITQRGKSNVAGIPILVGFLMFEYSYFKKWRKEVVDRRNNHNSRMAVIREEFKVWKENGKVMPKKLLVENEKPLIAGQDPIHV